MRMAEQSRRFVSLDKPVDKFIEDQKNKNTISKTRRDVSLPHLNTRRVGRIRDSYANKRRRRGTDLHIFREFSQPLECVDEPM